MAILSGDVKLLKSAVMADVVEGGGAPTGLEVVDGLSNAIFPDISELDRAGGRVNLRKTFVSVQTNDTDMYFGANVIVAEPPKDPRVSVTLFSNKLTFDTRYDAQLRIEAYLNRGAEMIPFLYENHIAGQRIIQLFQRPSEEVITVGHTLVLICNEGTNNEYSQYVRSTAVSAVQHTFTDPEDKKPYQAVVVSVSISDALRYDFPGSPQTNLFMRDKKLIPATAKVRDTTVADAGTYVGVVPLQEPVAMGDFTVHGSSIYTQLVPSAQTETPIIDSRPTQQAFAFVGAGGPLTQSITLAFTNTQNMFIGGMILPGTLTIERSGTILTDKGMALMNGAIQVGTVDYENGIATLTTNVWGVSGGTHTVVYTPAAKFTGSLKSIGFQITQESRSLSVVVSLEPAPAPGALTVAYMVARRWYVLKDSGGGVLKGLDSAYGAGTLNLSTGTVAITMGALPDVGSAVIFQWVDTSTKQDDQQTVIRRFNRLATPINTSGQISTGRGARAIQPSGLTMTWSQGGSAKTATDDGFGRLIGDADGYVDYTGGVVWWSPNLYPPKDTLIGLDYNGALPTTLGGISVFGGVVAANLQPLSVYMEVAVSVLYNGKQGSEGNSSSSSQSRAEKNGYSNWGVASTSSSSTSYSGSKSTSNVIVTVTRTMVVRDDGQGNLIIKEPGNPDTVIGSVDYVTGTIELLDLIPNPPRKDVFGPTVSFSSAGNWSGAANNSRDTSYWWQGASNSAAGSASSSNNASWQERWNDCYIGVNGTRQFVIGPQNVSVRFRTAGLTMDSVSVPLIAAIFEVDLSPYFSIGVMHYDQGGKRYLGVPSGALLTDISSTTGNGITVGEVVSGNGIVTVNTWVPNASPVITNYRCAQVAPGEGPDAPGCSTDLMFRTASAPLRPGSFQIVGKMLDGTTFNVTAGLDGKISGARVVGSIDYEVGLVKLWFIKRVYDQDHAAVVNYSFLGIAGLTWAEVDLANVSLLRYNAVSYSYLPLDAQLLGIDPVRLPSDGRVPIFRAGGFGVVGHTGKITTNVAPSVRATGWLTVTNGVDGDTFTVRGVDYILKDNPIVSQIPIEVQVGASDGMTASSMAAAISLKSSAFITTSISGSTINLTAAAVGLAANTYSLVGNANISVSGPMMAGGTGIDCGRVRLSRVRVLDKNGVVKNTGFSVDLEAGTLSFTDVTGWPQPITVEHRIEDMAIIRDAQINGDITFTRGVTHEYPMGSYVSSALVAGDLFARVSKFWDQATWTSVWDDNLIGGLATGTYNTAQYPIVVTNRGAVTERWVLQFTNTTTFNVIGEHVGVIATGNIGSTCAPINPATNVPYFTISALGWGAGWATGNIIRMNTIGSEFPVWVVRTVQQGPETVPDDSFTLLVRGDVDTP